MKGRLVQLLDLEQLTPSKFADIIGVQRSSVSHVISGRNNPSYDFLQKTLKAFPGLNAEWLMTGKGTMYEQMGREQPGTLFDAPMESPDKQFPEDIQDHIPTSTPQAKHEQPSEEPPKDLPGIDTAVNNGDNLLKKRVTQVMVFYDDDTFKSYRPSE